MKSYLSLILFLPLFGGVISAVAGRKIPRRLVETVAAGVICGSFLFSLLLFLDYREPATVKLFSWLSDFDLQAPLTLRVDQVSLVMCLMITFVCGLIHIYSISYMAKDTDYSRFFSLMNLFVFAMLLLVLAENLPLLYLGWEGVGFCSYALIGFWYQEERNATAGRKAFIVTRIGDTAFGIAIVWLFQLFNTVSITEINTMGFLMPTGIITTIGILFLIGAMGKSAQVPLMVWLPDAMAGPTPVSAQIHAATMVTAGVYILMRMFPFISLSPVALGAIAITGAITALYGASCALYQRDLKRVLAYSTISQIGYMVLGVGAGAIAASLFHLVVHAFFKALLFLAAGCVIFAMHHEQDILKMGGLRRSIPITFLGFAIGIACLAAIPLTGGFFSKDAILSTLVGKGDPFHILLYMIALATSFITAVYAFRLLYIVFGGSPQPSVHGAPRLMEWVLIPLAVLALFGGALDLPHYFGGGWLSSFVGAEGSSAPFPVEILVQVIATAAALGGLALVHFRYAGNFRKKALQREKEPTAIKSFFLNGWYADQLYSTLFITPFTRTSSFLWNRVDEGVVDRSLDLIGGALGGIGRKLGAWSSGRTSIYLTSFAIGAVALIGYLAWVASR